DGVAVDKVEGNGPELAQVAKYLDSVAVLQILAGDAPGRHPHGGLPGRGAAATAIVADAVLVLVAVIGVGGAKLILDLGVVLGALVGILDDHANGRAGGPALEHPGEDLHLVRLPALGGVAGLPGLAAIEVQLQIRLTQFEARGAAVDDATEGKAMALAKGGHREEFSKGVAGQERILAKRAVF